MWNELLLFYTSSAFVWFLGTLALMLWLFLGLRNNTSGFYVFFEILFEKAFLFFETILWDTISRNIHIYVVALFFIILISNMFGVFLELISPIVWINNAGAFILSHYITIPSADINFNLALAGLSVCILLGVQLYAIWYKRFFYDYIPLRGKWYITIESNTHSHTYWYMLRYGCAKICDIILSIFLGLLDIIGLFAKVISLSFRLFWNMTSGTVLLGITIVGLSGATQNWFGFDFPLGLPVLVYLQEILVGVIQAFVFALLVAIFIGLVLPEEDAV